MSSAADDAATTSPCRYNRRNKKRMRMDDNQRDTNENRCIKTQQYWGDGGRDVLNLVALRLSPPDLSSFQKVCSFWRGIPTSYPLGRSPILLGHRPKKDGKLCLFSPLYNRRLSLAVSHEVLDIFKSTKSHIVYSKHGWIVFFKYDEPEHPAIIFVNLLLSSSTAIIKWRMPERCFSWTRVSMSAPPTDPACIFLIMNCQNDGMEIITSSDGGREWKVKFFYLDEVIWCETSPVFHNNAFHFVGSIHDEWSEWRRINLGVYDPCRKTLTCHWYVLAIEESDECVIAESDGEMLGVFGYRGIKHRASKLKPMVYKLNESSMAWEEVLDLGGRVLCVDERSAITGVAEVEGMKDRIFYSKKSNVTEKADCEVHRPEGGGAGGPRLVPEAHVELAKLGTRARGELVGRSHRYYLHDVTSRERWRRYWKGSARSDVRLREEVAYDEWELEEWLEDDEMDVGERYWGKLDWMRAGVWVEPNWKEE